jgi:protein-S-isoprenylcysteine O-methyltransferase Ste14
MAMVATVLVLVGTAAGIVTLMRLGRSFSMMAEARRLVTSGPYRFVRHPLYLAEELAIIGLSMQFFSAATAFVLAVQIAFQLRRRGGRPRGDLPGILRLSAQDRAPFTRDLLNFIRLR